MSEHQDFVHLHLHTEYSLLDGFARIDQVVEYAKKLGMPALGITDHGTMFGVIDFYRACQDAEIKPIIGVEAYLAPRTMRDKDPQHDSKPYHLLLIAENKTGYQNLLKLSSAAQLEGFYYRPRVDHDLLAQHAEGVIATSGCLAAEIPRMIEDGREDKARELLGWYQDIFGKENFFLELQSHDIPQLTRLNKWLVANAAYANLPLLATNDVHYVRSSDYEPHDTLLCIQTGSLKNEANRLRMTDNSYYLRTQAEMWGLFGAYPDALNNSLWVAERCQDLELSKQEYHLPVFPVPAQFEHAGEYLRYLCEHGLEWRYGARAYQDPSLMKRLNHELAIIAEMGFDTYFLIVWDLCEFARQADIWWNVRGSGAGSVVAYSLGITNLDPLENGLLFERFLNPGRVSMPDFDLDFPEDRRMEMLDYCTRKYGEDKVAAIVTFGTLGAKAAIRDVGRALDIPLPHVDQIARAVPSAPKIPSIPELIGDDPEKAVPDLKQIYESDEIARQIIDTAAAIEGVPRHASTHAAGIIVADKPLVEYIPLHRPTSGDREESPVKMVTQFPMETAESIGLLKIDFLGLSTLTILRKACELIERYHDIHYTMDNIPFKPDPDDPETTRRVEQMFKMIGRGETAGVFQVESSGMRQMLREMKPKTFEHIVAAISLYRPGPMEYIPMYNRRMHGEEPVVYHHPKLVPILENTYGILVYQEQIMQVAAELFGYEMGEADLMRRAVSKKKEKDLMQHRQIFIERGPEHGVDEHAAIKIFDDIAFFARYGFNKCVVGSTEIVDAQTGRLVRVDDLAAGKAEVAETLSMDEANLRLGHGRITAVMNNGVKPVYRLTTQLGRQIEATANHPFYTFEGWRFLGELQPGDRIAVPHRIPVEGSHEWAASEVIALAHLLKDGAFDAIPDEVFELNNRQIALLLEQIGVEDIQFAERVAHQIQHLKLRLGVLLALVALPNGHYHFQRVDSHAENMPVGTRYIVSAETHSNYPMQRTASMPSLQGTPEDDIYWDRVVSIEYTGEQVTYDLSIEGTHNFVANDIIVHNSHAADYAVITCQTAYLKCHYPHEYMTALMSVYFDDSAKVSLFAADCRRMGIDVLPPSVNASHVDFSIEGSGDDRHIRFGMGAIKNVGTAAVEYLIQQRGNKPFRDLDDFLKRCDMRILGKRALESLIKVGAMDVFGDRTVMLANLEKLMNFSTEHHKNAAVGQVSMFDLLGGAAAGDAGSVRSVMTEVPPKEWNKREQLRWEKALMGLYVSDHPLTQIWSQILPAITHTTGDLNEDREQIIKKRVVIGGLVSDIRPIITKTGETMAVLTLEDVQGSIEVVLFPRTWGTYRDIVQVDKVFLVRGETDLRNNEVQVRADSLDQNFQVTSAADDQLPLLEDFPPEPPDDAFDEETGEKVKPKVELPPPPPESVIAPATAGASLAQPRLQPQLTPKPSNGNGILEEPPEFKEAYELASYSDDDYPYDDSYYPDDFYELPSPKESHRDHTAKTNQDPPQRDSSSDDLKPPHQLGAVFEMAPQPEPQSPRTLVVEMQRTLDSALDRRRMRLLVGIVDHYPGKDYFCLLFRGLDNRLVRLDFPRIQTHIHDVLEEELRKLDWVMEVKVYNATLDDLKISRSDNE